MLTLNYRDSRPIYEQIKDGLRRMIVTGAMAQDEKLPSVRALATQLSINPNTIQRAYNELEAEGYIYSVAGKGSFVAEQNLELAKERHLRDIEGHLQAALELGRQCGLGPADLRDMLLLLSEEE